MTITVLIVEDDPAMRHVLRKVIEQTADAEVIGEAGEGNRAIQIFQKLKPQVVFIDIDLPGKSGVELAREIFNISPWTYLVFATAFSHYRDDAFDLYAFDYLVKPFKLTRIHQTMERLRALITGEAAGNRLPLLPPKPEPERKKWSFKDGEKYLLLNTDEIIFITREGRESVIYTIDRVIHTAKGLKEIAEELAGYPFCRSHKGFIINLDMAREFIPSGRTSYQVVMANTDKRPLITWEKVKQLEEMMHLNKI